MYISAPTVDDLLRPVFEKLLKSKNRIKPTRGHATESIAVLLQITNPRARLSRSETKGRLFSALGELFWYLAGTKNLQFITYYLSRYRNESEDGRTVYGGYGPRLFSRRKNQVANVLALLRHSRDSRRAVIQLFEAADIATKHKEVPCTCTLQFLLRRGRLHMLTNMRSNDAFLGLPHDVFAFTMLQEIVARTLKVELGTYSHAIGSLHLYKRDRNGALQYLKEGWQSTTPMPPMPTINPWRSIRRVLNAERAIRCRRKIKIRDFGLHPYWEDVARLLQIYGHFKQKDDSKIMQIKAEMSVRLYDPYIEDLRNRLQKNRSMKANRL